TPGRAAIGRAVDAPLLLRPRRSAERAGEDDVRIRRMDDDATDASGLAQSHVGPRRAGVRRLVDAVTHHVGVADRPGLTGAGPDDVRVRLRSLERTDRLDRLLVEDGDEGAAAVDRSPCADR